MKLLAEKYKVKIVTPFGNLAAILCARAIRASLLFNGEYDKYPIRVLAHRIGVPAHEAFRPKQILQESSGILKLFENSMFDEIAELIPDGVSANYDREYYKHDPYLVLRFYIALKRAKEIKSE